jgi:regulator of replication initiation timing
MEGGGLLNFWRKGRFMFLGILFLLFFVSLSGPVPQAHAGFWDWVTGVSELPSDFNELKSKYDQIEQNLNASKEHYETVMQQLNIENEQLRLKNEQLTERLLLLEEEDQQQKKHVRRIVQGTLTLIGLLLLCFAVTRVLRVMVWRRNR